MKTTTFAIQKGGTGKTSVSVSVAGELAFSGKKTLLIDADPQGNSTGWIYPEIENEFADVLLEDCNLKTAILETHIENLYILPTAGIGGNLRKFSETATAEKIFAVKNLIDELDKIGFDNVIIDTSPAFGILEKMCFIGSDEIIAVLQLDIFSTDGLVTFANSLANLKKNMRISKPIFNTLILNAKDDRLQQQGAILSQFKEQKNFKQIILPVDQSFKKAQASQILIQELTGTKTETLKAIKNIASLIDGGIL